MQGDFFLTTWFLEAMKWIYSNIGSVFFTILISTVVLRAITVFSDIKTRKSSAQMAEIQPDLARLQKKYKDNPQRFQAEQSKLMKEKGVSMWGSCLPMLITMPLFFCFIAAFRFWSYEQMIHLLVLAGDPDTLPQAEHLMTSFRFLWINNIWQPDNGMAPVIMDAAAFLKTKDLSRLLYLQNNPDIWDKLVQIGVAVRELVSTKTADGVVTVETFRFLSGDYAIANYNAIMQPLADKLYPNVNNGWFILPVLSAGLQLLSAWIMQKNQPQTTANAQAQSTNKMMMYMFPVMTFIFCLSNSSAFAIYWTLSSLLGILVNLILNKKYPRIEPVQEDKK
ncbi:MAG TPA: YidC/Oxa1 family membrane protein insertase [Clostridia bacterium]|nr:YidC/Oxa1 family membrane protein insertase [Clostridia bacterium]